MCSSERPGSLISLARYLMYGDSPFFFSQLSQSSYPPTWFPFYQHSLPVVMFRSRLQ